MLFKNYRTGCGGLGCCRWGEKTGLHAVRNRFAPNRLVRRGHSSACIAGLALEGICSLIPTKQRYCKAFILQSTLYATKGNVADPGMNKVYQAADVIFQ
jgi:hypothetical protein